MNEFIKFVFSNFWIWVGFNISFLMGVVVPFVIVVESITNIAIEKYRIKLEKDVEVLKIRVQKEREEKE